MIHSWAAQPAQQKPKGQKMKFATYNTQSDANLFVRIANFTANGRYFYVVPICPGCYEVWEKK